ncbi:hypothetical protein P152DRAFT_459502 [Eremomyces bilateralis CBS 781.70]|uniref:Uncharacterized protein n=1 Tax=Eremomyces bilateralis CBS 781.70 TaxID=1392243 RepID=A0A6G1G0I8_9PEZI|nr:uncharacterized protein P152DRAFT_459502 [Eremomyces bilateralis CBS 781.70]KAF1811553.1 hypothetical protein P152DRAFT_459502 [Eremomyces bilateralis CBS 781.70]
MGGSDPKPHAPASAHPHANNIGGGHHGMIRYPKHVWSPTGGWYSQPANWKANTAIVLAVSSIIIAFTWKLSAEREVRYKMPDPDRFYPSRYWSKQIIEHEKKTKLHKEQKEAADSR